MIRFAIHIALSALLFLSVTGITVNMHYCRDQLYDLALFAPADDCCDFDADKGCCHHDDQMKDPGHCPDEGQAATSDHCDDETIRIESINDYFVYFITFDFEDKHSSDLLFTNSSFIENPVAAKKALNGLFNYKKPPPPQEVVLSRIQSFLI